LLSFPIFGIQGANKNERIFKYEIAAIKVNSAQINSAGSSHGEARHVQENLGGIKLDDIPVAVSADSLPGDIEELSQEFWSKFKLNIVKIE
jgi:hypothetical protein